ncbi:uncharacterized protein SCHCODRAFT_02643963 [Schizophyllum commune H4-8]|uniref:uncharacterized protein n=1 Tax=Schizophyllum commune (strain H4-8 / FGSC 9210) TaxID=578458 RepID=UPI0021602001|nr:uncharacterized protein SCHCODRAFT_02643963 [Schizophyllum commune H4-8]KAI5885638.1 hypothetical protein SCHCODRAFT_02643963 [Schizophyllum commune H4-8]
MCSRLLSALLSSDVCATAPRTSLLSTALDPLYLSFESSSKRQDDSNSAGTMAETCRSEDVTRRVRTRRQNVGLGTPFNICGGPLLFFVVSRNLRLVSPKSPTALCPIALVPDRRVAC